MRNFLQKSLLAVAFSYVCLPIAARAVNIGQQVPAVLVPQNVQFMYSNPYSLYACDFVVNETSSILKSLGARNVNVQCQGGIPYQDFNSVSATFTTVMPSASAQKSTVMGIVSDAVLELHDSCDLHLRIYQNVIKSFQVYSQQENDSCWDSSGDFQAKVTVLK